MSNIDDIPSPPLSHPLAPSTPLAQMRFFIISKGWQTLRGDLYDHCTPKDISGLYTWQARLGATCV